jgi:hypothetical protein
MTRAEPLIQVSPIRSRVEWSGYGTSLRELGAIASLDEILAEDEGR